MKIIVDEVLDLFDLVGLILRFIIGLEIKEVDRNFRLNIVM